MSNRKKLEPLDIKCTSTDCENNLHCFRTTQQMLIRNEAGRCRECGADLINWQRIQECNLKDAEHTIKALEYELIRHHFWHVLIDQRAVNYARRKGWIKLRIAVENRIRKSVGQLTSFDGRQTPKERNPIFYAQHATATCCRKCIEEWYGIPPDEELDDDQVKYMTEICMLYLTQRLPLLTEYGEKVPPIRAKKTNQ